MAIIIKETQKKINFETFFESKQKYWWGYFVGDVGKN
jgi:hypothetical protein